MKLLKSPFNIINKIGAVVLLILIVAEKFRFISLENSLALLLNISFAICLGFLLYLITNNVKKDNLIKDGLSFDAKILGINNTYLGFRIGGFQYCRFNLSYQNQNNETVYKESEMQYFSRNDFSYIRQLNNYELNMLFKVKVYVAKDGSGKYLTEVYRKIR